MMRYRNILHVMARPTTAMALVLFGSSSVAVAQLKPNMQEITTKWSQRESKVASARAAWDEEVTNPRGSITFIYEKAGPRFSDSRKGKVYPPADHTYTKPRFLSMDNNKLRYEYESQVWRDKREDTRHVFTFDGKSNQSLNEISSSHPQGSIFAAKRHSEITNLHLRPILLSFRILHSEMSPLTGADFRVTGRKSDISGHNCFEVSAQDRNGSLNLLWVDADRDFIVLRDVVISNTTEIGRLDIEYQTNTKAGWAPSSWSLVIRHVDGTLMTAARARVTLFEVNPRLHPNEFSVDFPVGTVVQDLRNGKRFLQGENGATTPVSFDNTPRPYRKLLTWPIVCAAIVLTLAPLALLYSRQFRSRRS